MKTTVAAAVTLLVLAAVTHPSTPILATRSTAALAYEFRVARATSSLAAAAGATPATATLIPSLSTAPSPAEPAGITTSVLPCSAVSIGCAGAPFLTDPGSSVGLVLAPRTGFAFELWFRPASVGATVNAVVADAAAPLPPSSIDNSCAVRKEADRSFELRQLGSALSFAVVDKASAISTPKCVTCVSPPGVLAAGALAHVVAHVPTAPDAAGAHIGLTINSVAVNCSTQPAALLAGANFDLAWSSARSSREIALGGRRDGKFFWAGSLYLVALYTAPLSPAALAANAAAGPYNTAPVAVPLALDVVEETPLAITLGAVDVNELAGAHTAIIVSLPVHGSLSSGATVLTPSDLPFVLPASSPMLVTYTPALDAGGVSDLFAYAVTDGEAQSAASATVSLTIIDVNDAPTGRIASPTGGSLTVAHSGTATVAIEAVADVDLGAVLTASVWTAHGLLTVDDAAALAPLVEIVVGDGVADSALSFVGSPPAIAAALASLTYTSRLAPPSSTTADTLSFTLSDGRGGAVADSLPIALVAPAINAPTLLASAPGALPRATTSLPITLALDAPVRCGDTLSLVPTVVTGAPLTFAPSVLSFASAGAGGPDLSVTFTMTAPPDAALGPVVVAFAPSGTAASKYAISLASPQLTLTTVVDSKAVAGLTPPPPPFAQLGRDAEPLALVLNSLPDAGTSLVVTLAAAPGSAGDATFVPSVLVFNDTSTSYAAAFVFRPTALGQITLLATLSGPAAGQYVDSASGFTTVLTTAVPACPLPTDVLDCVGACDSTGVGCVASPPPPAPPLSPPPPPLSPPPPPTATGAAAALPGGSSDDEFKLDSLAGILVITLLAVCLCLLCLLLVLLVWLIRRARQQAESTTVTTVRTEELVAHHWPPVDASDSRTKGTASSRLSPTDEVQLSSTRMSPTQASSSTTSMASPTPTPSSSSSTSVLGDSDDDTAYSAPGDEGPQPGDADWSRRFERKWRHTVEHSRGHSAAHATIAVPRKARVAADAGGEHAGAPPRSRSGDSGTTDTDDDGALSGLPLPSRDMIKVHKRRAAEQATIASRHKEHADVHTRLAKKHEAAVRKLVRAAEDGELEY